MSGHSNTGSEGHNESGSSSQNATDTKKPSKPPRFGGVELGIFVMLWVVMIIAFKLYTRSRGRKRGGWFGENQEKVAYERLLADNPDNEDALKRALMRRCITDVRRLMSLQEERESIMSLSRAGALSEDMLLSFKEAEKELELELFEVQAEAETFKNGWGEDIVRDSVRLMKIEDEVMEVKRRKEKEDRKKAEEQERSAAEQAKAERMAKLEEVEKVKLLEELLREEQNERESVSAASSSGAGSSKAKKRVAAGGKK